MKANSAGNVTFSKPYVIFANILVVRSCIDQHYVCFILFRKEFVDVNSDADFCSLWQLARRISEVLLGGGKFLFLPFSKTTIYDSDIFHSKLFKHICHHARAKNFVIGKLVASCVQDVRSTIIDSCSGQKHFGQVVG